MSRERIICWIDEIACSAPDWHWRPRTNELAPQPLSGAQSRARYGNKSTKKRQVKAFAMYTMPVY